VYLGPQSKAQRYFESHLAVEVHAHENPADVIMDSIAQSGDAYAKQWVLTGRDYLSKMDDITSVESKDGQPLLRLDEDIVHQVSKTLQGSVGAAASSNVSSHIDEPRATVLYPTPAAAAAATSNGTSSSPSHHSGYTNGNGHSVVIEMVGTNEAKKANSKVEVTTMTTASGRKRMESQVVIASREPRGAPFWQQFYLCHLRSLKQQHEKLSALVLESGVAMFAGFLMGVGGGQPHQVFHLSLIPL
jgi:hypothetical protein